MVGWTGTTGWEKRDNYKEMEMRRIKLTQNKFALVDDDMFDYLNKWKWYANKLGNAWYAQRKSKLKNGKWKTLFMHRIVLRKTTKDLVLDHINHNGLDNQRANLREATHQQNLFNRKSNINSTSKYKGVSLDRHRNKWLTQISVDGKHKYLGRFDDEVEAAKTYDEAAKKYFKHYACLNF